MEAREVIDQMGLVPHPEGGWYRETWRDLPADGGRGAGSAIYFLLDASEHSQWHRVDAAEVWHHYSGAPLELAIAEEDQHRVLTLESGPEGNVEPQAVVPARAWQAARPVGGWALLGCTVSPAFDFSGFELAVAGWQPPGWKPEGWSFPS